MSDELRKACEQMIRTDCFADVARAYLAEHPIAGGRRDMNLVMGVCTGLMTALGMPWRDQVASLCNFAGPFDETERRWKKAGEEAHQRLAKLLPAPDDGDVITEDWLRSVGFKFTPQEPPKCGGWVLCLVDFEIDEDKGQYGEELRLVDGGESGIWHVEVRSRASNWSEGVGLAEFRTRGHVRLFCKSLGIKLNGSEEP